MWNERTHLILLLSLSVLLSSYAFLQTPVISVDGAFQYIPMAKAFASNTYREGMSVNGQQPLYPFLMAFLSRWVSDVELAGRLVSSLFGVLLIFPVYFLGKRIFGRDEAFFATLFLVIHPYVRRYSADVLKESTYLFFFATALWFSLRTLQRDKVYPYLFIPFFSALPYLVRPDGVEVLLVVFFCALFLIKFDAPGKKGIAILLLLLSSGILFLPHLLYLKGLTGGWTLSKTKDIAGILGYRATADGVPLTMKLLYSFKKLNLEILTVYHPVFLFFFGVGLLRKRLSPMNLGEKFFLLLLGLHYVVLFLLILNFTVWKVGDGFQDYLFSGRHVLPFLVISIYWAGEGLMTVRRWMVARLRSYPFLRFLDPVGKTRVVWAALLVLTLATVLPRTLKPQRYEKLPEKWAGIWIKNQPMNGQVVFTSAPRVAYYADKPFQYVNVEKETLNEVKASMREKGAIFLVVHGKDQVGTSGGEDSLGKNFIEVMRYEEEGMERVVIYKRMT